jgi:hypothetical protein
MLTYNAEARTGQRLWQSHRVRGRQGDRAIRLSQK